MLKALVFVLSSIAFNANARADLTVSILGISPSSALPGETIQVQYRVSNIGDEAATSFVFRLYYSTNSTISTSDTYLNNQRNISSLAAGASTGTYTTSITVPITALVGTDYIGGIADYAHQVTEDNESNNTRSTAITILEAQADLTVNILNISPSSAAPGETIQVQYRISNIGDATANNFKFRLYYSTNTIISTSDTYLNHERFISSLAAGANTITYTANITVPISATAGTRYIGGIADYNSIITEDNESNNTRSTAITILPIRDLSIDLFDVTETTITAGEIANIQYRIKNIGTELANNFTLRLYYSTNSTITTGDTYLNHEVTINSLAAGASTIIYSASITIPASATSGTRYIGAYVDYNHQVSETNESNNTNSESLSICAALPTLSQITGNTSVCESATEIYSITSISEAISYTWTLPSGWSGTSTSNSINTTIGSSGGSITVIANNSCGSSSTESIQYVIITPTTTIIPEIFGNESVCENSDQTYSVTSVSGATSYNWTLPSGWTGTSSNNTITCTTNSLAGEISVSTNNTCNVSSSSTIKNTYITPVTAQPSLISGNTSVCDGVSETYSVSSVSAAISYNWTLPNGWTGTSTSNTITSTTSADGGAISVTANNACGIPSTPSSININSIIAPTQPVSIQGNSDICKNTSQTYTTSTVIGATSYTWNLPSGWTGSSTNNMIICNSGTTGGVISVTANNLCGISTALIDTIEIIPLTEQPSAIIGDTLICINSLNTYSTISLPGAISYNWTLPSGWTGSSTSNYINCTSNTSGGTITVSANNVCGEASTSVSNYLNVLSISTPLISLENNNTLHSSSTEGNQWYNQDGIISGATNQDYTVIENGEYYVIVSSNNCHSNMSNTVNVSLTTINDNSIDNTISIYPNPTEENFIISVGGKRITKGEIIIYNTNGKAVKHCNISNNTSINVSDLLKGIYYVRIITKKSISTKKLIIK